MDTTDLQLIEEEIKELIDHMKQVDQRNPWNGDLPCFINRLEHIGEGVNYEIYRRLYNI